MWWRATVATATSSSAAISVEPSVVGAIPDEVDVGLFVVAEGLSEGGGGRRRGA